MNNLDMKLFVGAIVLTCVLAIGAVISVVIGHKDPEKHRPYFFRPRPIDIVTCKLLSESVCGMTLECLDGYTHYCVHGAFQDTEHPEGTFQR